MASRLEKVQADLSGSPGRELAASRYLAKVEPERWASVVVNNNDPLDPVVGPAF